MSIQEHPKTAVETMRSTEPQQLELIRELKWLNMSLEYIIRDMESPSPLVNMRPIEEHFHERYPELAAFDYIIGDWGLKLIRGKSVSFKKTQS